MNAARNLAPSRAGWLAPFGVSGGQRQRIGIARARRGTDLAIVAACHLLDTPGQPDK
jgi:ABC-type proline/glycine betaine transport system ATPase subunit